MIRVLREVVLSNKRMWMPHAKTESGTGIVLAPGAIIDAKAECITCSAETAHLFEQPTPSTNAATSSAFGMMN